MHPGASCGLEFFIAGLAKGFFESERIRGLAGHLEFEYIST